MLARGVSQEAVHADKAMEQLLSTWRVCKERRLRTPGQAHEVPGARLRPGTGNQYHRHSMSIGMASVQAGQKQSGTCIGSVPAPGHNRLPRGRNKVSATQATSRPLDASMRQSCIHACTPINGMGTVGLEAMTCHLHAWARLKDRSPAQKVS
eukprot:1136557-Pelagomonas_calceolata.AAC.1